MASKRPPVFAIITFIALAVIIVSGAILVLNSTDNEPPCLLPPCIGDGSPE